jgi:hypothetical protein
MMSYYIVRHHLKIPDFGQASAAAAAATSQKRPFAAGWSYFGFLVHDIWWYINTIIYIYYHYILYLILVIMICQFNVVQFVFLAGEEGFVPVSIWVHEKTTIASGPALHQVARRHWPRQAWQARRRVHALSGWNSHGLYTVNLCAMWVGSKKWGPENPPIFGHVLHGLIMFDLLKKYAFYINFSTYNSSSYRSCVVFAFRLQQRRQYSLRT